MKEKEEKIIPEQGEIPVQSHFRNQAPSRKRDGQCEGHTGKPVLALTCRRPGMRTERHTPKYHRWLSDVDGLKGKRLFPQLCF